MEFDEIYRTYFHDVFFYIRRLSHDEHIAEEITSETFFRALRSINSFRGECDLRVWLCQIAKNCYYSEQKKNGRLIPAGDTELQELPDAAASPEERIADHEDAMRIQELLHHIPEPYREVFLWRVFADLSFRQIGQIFHKSENWACVTYHRARKMLRERLEGYNHEK